LVPEPRQGPITPLQHCEALVTDQSLGTQQALGPPQLKKQKSQPPDCTGEVP
jgi:hypothetical protein